jgi:hypothetical protein
MVLQCTPNSISDILLNLVTFESRVPGIMTFGSTAVAPLFINSEAKVRLPPRGHDRDAHSRLACAVYRGFRHGLNHLVEFTVVVY